MTGYRVLDGPAGLAAVAPYYDDLLGSAPITARWHWISTWTRTHPSWRPLTVVVDGPDGPAGVALLTYRRRGPLQEVTAVGHGLSDYARFPVRTAAAVPALADGICRAIRGLHGPRRVRLDGFPAADPVLERVSGSLPGATLLDGDGAPVVPLTPGVEPLASGHREARVMARRGHNRLRTDGRALLLEHVSSAADVATLLPELERLHRARDHEVRGFSDIDDPENLAFWSTLCLEAAARGELELSTMRIDGDLAAYLTAFRDGCAYRVWDPRISPSHTRYNPGHVLRADVLTRVAAGGGITEFDWMRGVERYKLATTSTVVPTQRLVAWSPGWAHRVEPWARAARAKVAAARSGSGNSASNPTAARPTEPAGPPPNSTLPPAPPRSGQLAALVDRVATGALLVVGSLPPHGRDLDVLVNEDDVPALHAALQAAGFTAGRDGWLRWVQADDRVRADVVDVLTGRDWGLDATQRAWLRAEALPLPGHRWLHRPSPAAALLILARRYAAAGGVLTPAWAERIAAALDEDPAAWDIATAHARAWQAAAAVRALREHAAGNAPSFAMGYRLLREHRGGAGIGRTLLPLRAARQSLRSSVPRHRPAVVALSGVDGAGKTSQAALLVSALQDLGLRAAPGWSRLSYREWLWALDRGIVAVVGFVRRPAPASGAATPTAPTPTAPHRPHRALRQRYPVLTWAWAWAVTLDAVVAQRRLLHQHRGVDVVVCDRYTLDSDVHLREAYGATIDVAPHVAALSTLLPRPLAAFFLRLEADKAHARKPDDGHTVQQLQQQAHRYEERVDHHRPMAVLDATQPPGELAERIARQVYSARTDSNRRWRVAHSRRPLNGETGNANA